VVSDREASLPATDDNGLDALCFASAARTARHRPHLLVEVRAGRYERAPVRAIGSSPNVARPCSIAKSAAAARVDTPIFL
jgi:hypothetical protein